MCLIFEKLGIVGAAVESGEFDFEDFVEVGDGGDGGGVDGGVPEVDGGVITGFGWWHGRSLLGSGLGGVMNPTKGGAGVGPPGFSSFSCLDASQMLRGCQCRVA